MRAIKKLVLLFLAIGGAANQCAPAAETPMGQTNAPPLEAELRHEEGPGQLPADRVYITAGTNKFSFLIPSELKLQTSNERVVNLSTRDLDCQISFRLAWFQPPSGSELSAEFCQKRLLAAFPSARIIKSFASFADSRTGVAFELELPGPAGSWRHGQLAFIPSHAGLLEFSLSCSPGKFDSGRQKLSTVMLTFRASDEKGQLHISPLSDRL